MGLIIWLSAWVVIAFIITTKTKSLVKIIGGGLLGSIAIILIIFFIDGSLFVGSDAKDICSISQAFKDNEMAAIAEYEGKWFLLKGVAGQTGNSVAGLFLQLPCGQSWPAAQCFFKKSKASDLARISPGQTVYVKGKCTGKTLGCVMFNNCSIVEKYVSS